MGLMYILVYQVILIVKFLQYDCQFMIHNVPHDMRRTRKYEQKSNFTRV